MRRCVTTEILKIYKIELCVQRSNVNTSKPLGTTILGIPSNRITIKPCNVHTAVIDTQIAYTPDPYRKKFCSIQITMLVQRSNKELLIQFSCARRHEFAIYKN